MTALLSPGTVLGDEYEIVRSIGSGGMGAVYEVRQKSTGALRALKTMHAHLATDPTFRTRFEQEAKVVAKIASDHVVQVLGAGVDEKTQTPWIALELLEGKTLADHLDSHGALPVAEVLEIYAQVAHALSAAHGAGVVHRDLKPENLFLATSRRRGEKWMVKILDFGIAKILAGSAHSTAAMGTPMWMAPEQTSRGASVSPASDIWAMALVVFDMLTCFAYWRAVQDPNATTTMLLTEILVGDLDPASVRAAEYGRKVPKGFDEWFARCLQRDPKQRFQDITEAHAELAKVLDAGPDAALAETAPYIAPQAAPRAPTPTPVAQAPARTTGNAFANTSPGPPPAAASSKRSLVMGALAVTLIGGVGYAVVKARTEHATTPPVAAPSIAPAASPAPPPKPSTSALALDPHVAMLEIDGGGFKMGATDGAYDEKPVHEVTTAGVLFDSTLVTAAQYQACVKAGLCTPAGNNDPLCNGAAPDRANHPINCVNFAQAKAYCAAVGKRLPNEEEWEMAAKGPAARKYPWGEAVPKSSLLCWGRKNEGTCPVGAFASGATPQGLLDMAGNVWQWTSTPYCSYTNQGCNEERRVTRGGSFATVDPLNVRTTTRMGQEQASAGASLGFRCARTR